MASVPTWLGLSCVNTLQPGVVLEMSDAGKSVLVAELVAQKAHMFGFRVVVEGSRMSMRGVGPINGDE